MSEVKIKTKEKVVEENKTRDITEKVIFRDSKPKLDTSALNHGGTILHSNEKKEKKKK